jgi:hypothetical protein
MNAPHDEAWKIRGSTLVPSTKRPKLRSQASDSKTEISEAGFPVEKFPFCFRVEGSVQQPDVHVLTQSLVFATHVSYTPDLLVSTAIIILLASI